MHACLYEESSSPPLSSLRSDVLGLFDEGVVLGLEIVGDEVEGIFPRALLRQRGHLEVLEPVVGGPLLHPRWVHPRCAQAQVALVPNQETAGRIRGLLPRLKHQAQPVGALLERAFVKEVEHAHHVVRVVQVLLAAVNEDVLAPDVVREQLHHLGLLLLQPNGDHRHVHAHRHVVLLREQCPVRTRHLAQARLPHRRRPYDDNLAPQDARDSVLLHV
mmetsp:Transcript_13436/g.34649  ORF Transcript_13436/g.34649 Transcript_13436/m.34649 type:complete len:217 (+) Transcript_13436:59-709(+)